MHVFALFNVLLVVMVVAPVFALKKAINGSFWLEVGLASKPFSCGV
jgi:hypothetical protein